MNDYTTWYLLQPNYHVSQDDDQEHWHGVAEKRDSTVEGHDNILGGSDGTTMEKKFMKSLWEDWQ